MAATKTTKKSTKKKNDNFKYLVIVESPAKSKTLTKILGSDYLVKSSVGHIRDLPSKGLGIDVKSDFEPTYEIMSGKKKVVDDLNDSAKKADLVYLASDPDREGEAIAWHLSQILNCPKKNVSRITFNQITPDAVKNAVASPRDIDMNLVDAQQARRVLDRLVGYKISPILWRKIGGRSAGRVQSIAVRLICEREEEIINFVPEEYWSLKAEVKDTDISASEAGFLVNLVSVDGKRIVSPLKNEDTDKTHVISNEAEMNEIIKRIESAKLHVSNLGSRPSSRKPQAPFKTSTLQRAASNALGYGVKKTMQVAQTLYEGVKLGTGGDQVGLITYMRTDSLRIAPEAQEMAKEYIVEKYGAEYYPATPNSYAKKSKKNEQDAHEAIRPSYIDKDPDSIRKYLTDDQYRLYRLIWQRFVASQMNEMKLDIKTLEISSAAKDLVFKVSQSKVTFKGYSAVYGNAEIVDENKKEKEENVKFPDAVAKGHAISVNKNEPAQHFTEGPPRYNEASLVKTLEELGIGRPSTYAPTISTIVDRNYVVKVNTGGALGPTKLGMSVNGLLVDHFGRFINTNFTSQMEEDLDKIAHSGKNWRRMLKEFYLGTHPMAEELQKKRGKAKEELMETIPDEQLGFVDLVKKASKEIENIEIKTDHDCPKCDAKMLLKSSRFGPFLGCSNYPDCDAIINLTKDGKPAPDDRPYTEKDCPKCDNSSLVIRYGRYGDYIACTTKDCGHTEPLLKKTGIACTREGCKGDIVEKKSRFGKIFYGCSTWSETQCDVVFWYPPIDQDCPKCGKKMVYKNLKRGDKIACSDTKGCGFNRLATIQEQNHYNPQPTEEEAAADKSVFSL